MRVYLCGGGFEEILCGVYDAWADPAGRSQTRLALARQEFQPSFFEEYIRSVYEEEKFRKASRDLQANFTTAERILAWNAPLLQFCIYAVITAALYIGAQTIIDSQGLLLNVGGISSIVVYGMQILMSLNILSMVFTMISMSMESAERIEEILDEDLLSDVYGQRVYIDRRGGLYTAWC